MARRLFQDIRARIRSVLAKPHPAKADLAEPGEAAARIELQLTESQAGSRNSVSAVDGWCAWGEPSYCADRMATWTKNIGFLRDARFMEAYRAGMDSGHHIVRPRGSTEDIHIEWRVAVCCWAARHGCRLPGDFVECGVNTGILSLAVCRYVDFNASGKHFYLFDTFSGIPVDQMSDREKAAGREEENSAWYSECWDIARRNFAPYPNVHLIRGRVPDTLASVGIEKVAYLSIDMNITLPEIAAMRHFWGKLVPGALVVLDDYGWAGHAEQKSALDEFATERGVEILTLPTGQGLLIKS